ncbi:hypothetical protein TRAPUB_6491 [Trametes pubescens]|uniref:Uncharacterized protein n=1 Tax=Trametes pubescens TaxID=154538 RepID=A0A1M2V5V3_TRAPU|nr:hypothetical protein TRAPUB_6491 [Trametes pubescens]
MLCVKAELASRGGSCKAAMLRIVPRGRVRQKRAAPALWKHQIGMGNATQEH